MKHSRLIPPFRLAVAFASPIIVAALIAGVVTWRTKARWLPHGLRQQARQLYREARAATLTVSPPPFPPERADKPMTLYAEGLTDGWADWSWATRDMRSAGRARSGEYAISLTAEGFKGVYLHHGPFGTTGYGEIELYVYAETSAPAGSLSLSAAGGDGKSFVRPVRLPALPGATWTRVVVSLSDLGVRNATVTGFVVQDAGNDPPRRLLLDDIRLLPDATLPAAPVAATLAVRVDMGEDRHPISPLIYGVAHLPDGDVKEWHLGAHRWGGNANTRHNWKANAWNSARDWEFRNHGAKPAEGRVPGETADGFVRVNKSAGVATVMTVPTIGWVARNGDNASRSLDVPRAGGPALKGDKNGAIMGYDPRMNRERTSVRSVARTKDARPGDVSQEEWVRHLVATHGTAAKGGVPIYAMDNEPDLWGATHTDVHPALMGYDDIVTNFVEYASMVKDVDPSAKVTGPVTWGWTGYFYSALDRGDDNFGTHPDRRAHGNVPFLPWFLKTMREHDRIAGRRTLDILDVHYYPQGQGLYSPAADHATRERRLRSTRSLWDPAYVDESWIGEPVRLVPRLREWIAQNYPGTRIGITEWNFGADGDISGALAIVETLGVFGREDVYLANYWTAPKKGSPGHLAFQLLRNVDGEGRGFGDTSGAARSEDVSRLSAFAATDSGSGDLTILLVNKMRRATVTAPVTVQSASAYKGSVPVLYRLTEGGSVLTREDGTALTGGTFTVTLPPYSALLIRVPKGGAAK